MASNDAIRCGAIRTFPCKILLLLLGLLTAVVIAGLAPSEAQAVGYYDVWVGDVHVDGQNKDDVLAESHNGSTGKVSFKMVDSSQGHAALYLDNANIKVANDGVDHSDHAAGIFVRSDIKRLDIYLIGKNTITVPSGALSSGNIYGIASFASASDDSTIDIYPKQTGASLSMTLSGDYSDVYGIYNSNDGVEIEGVTLSAVLSSGYDACGICCYDGNVDIAKATVNMSISGDESADGIRAGSSVFIGKSTVDLSLGQNKKSRYGTHGVYIQSNIGGFYVMNDSTVVIDIGESSDYNYGVNNKGFVRVEGGSALHVNVGYAPNNSIGMLGSNLFVEDGSAAAFSGYTQAIRSSVVIDSNTQSLGAFVNTSPTFRGGNAWNGSTSLSSYKYVHFPQTLNIFEAIISAIANQKYTGKVITPAITVTFGNTVLAKGVDYAVSYANNVKPGKATATITGKGLFEGEQTAVFTISHTVKWNRIWGATAPITMQMIAAQFGKTKSAIVTTDASYKDALAASALAGKCNGLVLMTKKGSLTPQTKAAIKAAGVKNVYIVGSTANVSAAVEKQLKSGTGVTKVVRIAGSTPSQRAVNAAKYGGKKSDTVIIATQNSFQDALSIAPYSYATKSPILYAETNKKLSTATVNYIKSAKYKKAIVIGGPLALPASIDTQLKSAGVTQVTRLAGANAYRTSELIANWSMGRLSNGNHDKYKGKPITYVKFQPTVKLGANKLAVSTGQNWLDALAGAALCGKNRSVMLLADTKGGNHYANAVQFCKTYKLNMTSAYIFGGTSAVSAATANALAAATK